MTNKKQNTTEQELNKLGRPKGGRPTKEQQLQKAIADKNSAALEKHLTTIRLQLFDLVAQETDTANKTADRAKQLQSLKNIYDIGNAVLSDLKREEAAANQKGEQLKQLLSDADNVLDELGWGDE